ncbi:DUF4776 domain-containing protein [Selenomonas ruminantium]|uniref:DUF4776 domain-containing protein n=1 Tax=Selenomonas ruminantium TaxID=971 RepID=A0A1K1Q7L8_SELRU|nr:DUF4776 domain-containing protein [Selenomonas ruminantium]SFW55962.1 hypothetical protein SAMN02910323_2445 [Selenomonas ruminantium]
MSSKNYIKCQTCGHTTEINKEFFVKVLGGAAIIGGWKAWIGYIFAGTGFAFAICVAIVAGGVAMMAYSEEITQWLSERYACPKCGGKKWRMMTAGEKDSEIRRNHTETLNEILKRQNSKLNDDIKEGINYVRKEQGKVHKDIKCGFSNVTKGQEEIRKGIDKISARIDTISESLKVYKKITDERIANAYSQEEREYFINEFTNQVIDKIEACFKNQRDSNRYKSEENNLKFIFGNEWGKLSDTSKKSLITAKILFNDMSMSEKSMDYSGVCILVAKAFEIELKDRFFSQFISYLEIKHGNDYSKWPFVLIKDGKRKPKESYEFTLGSVVPLFCIKKGKKISSSTFNVSKKAIQCYCEEVLFTSKSKKDIDASLIELAQNINIVREKYRNPAAHTRALAREDAQQCFNDIVDMEQMLINFLKMCKA